MFVFGFFVVEYSPVILSHNILEVIIFPYGLNNCSKSGCVIFLGRPETYRLAPFIDSELGRAIDTYVINKINRNRLLFCFFFVY